MNLDTSQADTAIRPPRPADTHAEPPRPAAPATLTESLRPAAVDVARLGQEVGSLLRLVRLLIGVVPNCDGYLAIWPPGFRTYNLLVPNCLNLPFSIWGWGPPVVPLGLALYTASWTARCAYCTAHTCAFALRRGAPTARRRTPRPSPPPRRWPRSPAPSRRRIARHCSVTSRRATRSGWRSGSR
jgi:hypothetical protein